MDARALAADVRDYLRANLLDGDEGGTLTMSARDLLDEVEEAVVETIKEGD